MTAPVLLLHDWALDDRCYAVRLGAVLMGVSLTTRSTARAADDGPALETGGGVLQGAVPILSWLARDTPWAAHTPEWTDRATALLDAFSALRRRMLLAPVPEAADPAAGRTLLRALEDRLSAQRHAGSGWIAGNRPTIVDIAAFPVAALSHDLEIPHDLFPEVRRFIRGFRTLPGFVTMPGIPEYH